MAPPIFYNIRSYERLQFAWLSKQRRYKSAAYIAICFIYGTAQFKLDTRVQQTHVHLTDFVEAHASCSHAGCMAREHMHDRIHLTRHARATPRGTPEAYCTQTDALAWLMHGVKLIKWKGLRSSIIYSVLEIYQSRVLRHSAI